MVPPSKRREPEFRAVLSTINWQVQLGTRLRFSDARLLIRSTSESWAADWGHMQAADSNIPKHIRHVSCYASKAGLTFDPGMK